MSAAQAKPQIVQALPAEPHPAIDYLEGTFREDDWIFFFGVHAWKTHLNKKGESVADVKKYSLMPLAVAASAKTIAQLERDQANDWNIFVSMNPFPEGSPSRIESLIETIRNCFIETDGGDALTAIALGVSDNVIPAPHSILESSPGKYHITWHVDGFTPEEAKAMNRALASRFGGDIACVDLHRILRMPGFRNLKPKYPDKPLCKLVEPMNGDPAYTRKQFNIKTVVLKADSEPVSDEILVRVISKLEENAAEAKFSLGARERDLHGYRWDVTCPWAETHTYGGKDAILMVLKNGRIEFSCLHNHCAERGWSDVRAFWAQAAGHEQKFAQVTKETEHYRVVDGELCAIHYQLIGPQDAKEWAETIEPLANFSAKKIKNIELDDGVTKVTAHVINGARKDGRQLPEVRVLAKEFQTMGWVSESWTVYNAILRAGLGIKDKLREAIETLSDDPEIEHVYTHTGWVKLESGWAFLHAGGAINGSARVDLSAPALERYLLPSDAKFTEEEAMNTALALVDVAPAEVTVPLFSAMFRTVLASQIPLNVTIWLDAPTGNLKTTLASLFLCLFGEFDVTHSPANWSSTINALEHQAFLLQDLPLLVDEYVPTSARDVRELEAKAARLIRSQGNLTGRGRMDSNLRQRLSFSPRGLIISTGEGRPPGESIAARCIVLEPRRANVNLAELTRAQERAEQLPYAMSGYMRWLAPQLDKLRPELLKMQREGRLKLHRDAAHLRVPETVSSIGIGAELALRYAIASKAINKKQADEYRKRFDEALSNTVVAHAERVREENPARRFLRVLVAALDSGQALMWHKDSDKFPPMDVVGWYDDEFLYLIPEVAQKIVAEFCQRQGEPFCTRQRVVREQLTEMNVLEPDKDQCTRVVRCGYGKQKRALQLWRARAEALTDGGTFPNDPPQMVEKGGKK